MIEVENKFQPTDEQLTALLADAKFVGEIVFHDTYYDYSDYSLFEDRVYFRNRDGHFELKIQVAEGSHEEIDDEAAIQKYFNTTKSLANFIRENLIEVINVTTRRRKYLKEAISIEVDEMDFGYKCIEIEILVALKEDIPKALEKIMNLAKQYGFKNQKAPAKRKEYFRVKKPLLFEEFYGE